MSSGAALRLVHDAAEAAPFDAFCGYCAAPPGDRLAAGAAGPGSRVCSDCGLGVLLEAPRNLVPKAADAFMVVDSAMSVTGLSQRCEQLLGASEPEAAGRHLTDLLSPADAEARAAQGFLALVLLAATGRADPSTIAVMPAGQFGVRFWARISPCGPGSAAMLLLHTID